MFFAYWEKSNNLYNWTMLGLHLPNIDFGTNRPNEWFESENHFGVFSTEIKLLKSFGFLILRAITLGFGISRTGQWDY